MFLPPKIILSLSLTLFLTSTAFANSPEQIVSLSAKQQAALQQAQLEKQTLEQQGKRLDIASLRGLQSEHYLSRRRPEPNVSFEASHKGWPAALVFSALQKLIAQPLGEGGAVYTFTQADEINTRFALNEKEKTKLAAKEHAALVEGLLLALGESKHKLAPYWLQTLSSKRASWEATRWLAYGISLRFHPQKNHLLAQLSKVALNENEPLLVREAALSALGSVPSQKSLSELSTLLTQPNMQTNSFSKITIAAMGRLGDARLARRHKRIFLSEQAFQKILQWALENKTNTETEIVTQALLSTATATQKLEDGILQLHQSGKTVLAQKLTNHLRLRKRRL